MAFYFGLIPGKDKINTSEFLQRYQEEKKLIKEKISYVKKIVGKNNMHFIHWLQFIIFYRTHRTDVLNRTLFQAIPMLERYATSKNIKYQELIHCTKEEILSDLPSKEIIHERMKGFAMLSEEGKLRCVQGKEFLEIKNYFKDEKKEVTEFMIDCYVSLKMYTRLKMHFVFTRIHVYLI